MWTTADAIALWGHNVAETQTVLWMRMLDRRRGLNPPAMLAVDPRPTPVAREADVHLPIRPGTNLALMNGLLRQILHKGWAAEAYVAAHTLGFEDLRRVVEAYEIDRVAEICGLKPADIERAAELLGTAERLLSTVLQGFYQSHQATAAAVAVNNLHLLRGMIGRPGAGVLQMNGQPTAQKHPRERRRRRPAGLPQLGQPRPRTRAGRAVERRAGHDPALGAADPRDADLPVRRAGLDQAAVDQWHEPGGVGTFTNADRTVHLSEKAVDPPGSARADLDIFLDYAARMDFRDRDGEPLITWTDAESAYAAWQRCSAGRPCDYTPITYERLRGGSGVQWGGERLYPGGVFNTDSDYCETYGQDLSTGAELPATQHRAKRPDGRAFLLATDYVSAPEVPSDEFPLRLVTGRTVYQFHTRTKTGRVPELDEAAPQPWVELHPGDAPGIRDGDVVRVESPRGAIEVPARLTGIRPGVVFVPFHYAAQAANELTITAWDPVSKQPQFKLAAVRVRKA